MELHYVVVAGFNYMDPDARTDPYGEMAYNRLRRLFGTGEAYGGEARLGDDPVPGEAVIVVTLFNFRRRDRHGFPPHRGDDEPRQVLQTRFRWNDPRPDFEDPDVWSEVPAFRDRIGTSEIFYKKNSFNADRAPAEAERVLSIVDVYLFLHALALTRDRAETLWGGARAPAVVEVSIISHAFSRGPILVNSYEDPKFPGQRTPTDRDARSHRDFAMPPVTQPAIDDQDADITMFDDFELEEDAGGDIALPRFDRPPTLARDLVSAALRSTLDREIGLMNHFTGVSGVFHPSAAIWIWGCNAQRRTRNLVQDFLDAAKEAGVDLEGRTVAHSEPEVPMPFEGSTASRAYLAHAPLTLAELRLPVYGPIIEVLHADERTLYRTVLDTLRGGWPGVTPALLDEVNRRIEDQRFQADISLSDLSVLIGGKQCYCYGIAKAFQVPCYAAAPGTWSVLQSRRTDRKIPFPVTEVPVAGHNYRTGDGDTQGWAFDWLIEFYEKHYEMTFDPETHFACFDPGHPLFDRW